MKKYLVLAAVTLALLVGVLLVPWAAEAALPEVELVSLMEYPYAETLTVTGTVEPVRKKELTLRYPIVPDQVLAEVGDAVSYGDVLATVDVEATKRAVVAYAARYADALPANLLPEGLQTALNAVEAEALFESLDLPTKVVATATGTLTALALNEGELFLPQSAAAEIATLHPLRLRLNVAEGDVNRVRIGQRLLFTASAVEGGTFAAAVTRVLPTAYQKLNGLSFETVVDVLATVEEDFDVLRPGYSVRAEIPWGQEETLRLLPYEAILQDADGVEYVYVYREGKVQRRDVKTGVELSTSTAITYGVGPYELVVRDASAIKGDGPVRVAAGSGKEGLWNP